MNIFNFFVYLDSAVDGQFGFQDPATPIMEGIIDLHHHIFFFLVVILFFVLWFMYRILDYFFLIPSRLETIANEYLWDNIGNKENYVYLVVKKLSLLNKVNHHHTLEIIWTIIPSLILILIAIPSFSLLYSMDEIINPAITIKAIGHQWYWSYEYSDYVSKLMSNGEDLEDSYLNFDSYMVPTDELELGQLRLLEVDNCVVVPAEVHVRVIVTAADVLHSWAVPSLGVKVDAVPGRLNQTSFFIKREGIFYGQCSEICGVNHGFMPIVVKATSLDNYVAWVSNQLN